MIHPTRLLQTSVFENTFLSANTQRLCSAGGGVDGRMEGGAELRDVLLINESLSIGRVVNKMKISSILLEMLSR